MRMTPDSEPASLNNLRSWAVECFVSSPSRPFGSEKAVAASSNEIPCFSRFVVAFRSSHSNILCIYITKERSQDRCFGVPIGRQRMSGMWRSSFYPLDRFQSGFSTSRRSRQERQHLSERVPCCSTLDKIDSRFLEQGWNGNRRGRARRIHPASCLPRSQDCRDSTPGADEQ